jgi:hypothetical protein
MGDNCYLGIDIVDISDKLDVLSQPCCPLCDKPIDLGEPMALGQINREWVSFCLVHSDCAKERKCTA